jgi:hypothetical protein
MSDGLHVHGPHDHALEHAAEHGSEDSFSGRIAVATAVLATVGALMSFQGGATQAEAMLQKNEAAIKKTEASDQWNFFQSKGQKQSLAEMGALLSSSPEVSADLKQKAARYDKEKAEIKKEAEKLEALGHKANLASEVSMHHHHRWAQAITVIQVSIALSAIALLTRRKWLQWGVYAMGLCSLAIGVAAWIGL